MQNDDPPGLPDPGVPPRSISLEPASPPPLACTNDPIGARSHHRPTPKVALAFPRQTRFIHPDMRLLPVLASFLLLPASAGQPAPMLDEANAAATAGLWEIAAFRLEKLAADPSLPKTLLPEVAIRLAEAWIHTGQHLRSIALLEESKNASHPEAPFWTGQALAAAGRIQDAIQALQPAASNPASPHHTEAAFTLASLQLAIHQPTAALLSLKPLANATDRVTAARAHLMRTEILTDLADIPAARAALPQPNDLPAADRPRAAFIHARLLLAEKNPSAAAAAFADLLNSPEGQTLHNHHAAAIGLADALAALETPAAAATSLIAFLNDHPDSPLLDAAFARLLHWLPNPPSPTDPILTQLAKWLPPLPPPPASCINASTSDAVAAWPSQPKSNELAAYALFHRAKGLRLANSPESNAEAKSLLNRLWLEFPDHPLAARALILAGQWLLSTNTPEKASNLLAAAHELARSPTIQGQALFLKAQAAFTAGSPAIAAQNFDQAASLLEAQAADTARLNAAISQLQQGLVTNTTPNPPALSPPTQAELELEQALANPNPAAALAALESFLARHPNHARTNEARLAIANNALSHSPPSTTTARAQIQTIESSPQGSTVPQDQLALAKIRLADLSANTQDTITAAKAFLESYPTHPLAPDVTLTLGRNQFQTGDFNLARMTLEKLASTDKNPPRAQVAWLLAARAAALVPSPQSREEAVNLFDQAIRIDAPLDDIARLEKARLTIDLNRLAEATTFLRNWMESLPKDAPLRLPAGFLLGESITLDAADDPASLSEALTIYQQLLTHPKADPATRHRLKFLCGQTLEQLPDPKDPTAKRIPEALEAYFSVLEAATKSPPAEWDWFERCGFRALEIYENAQRWQPAIAIARKIASFKGPRAEEAANRARILQLKHMVWEE